MPDLKGLNVCLGLQLLVYVLQRLLDVSLVRAAACTMTNWLNSS